LYLKETALDPMIRDYCNKLMEGMMDMVINDKADINAGHTALVNFVKPGAGTYESVIRLKKREGNCSRCT
jgi:hypothetical protein